MSPLNRRRQLVAVVSFGLLIASVTACSDDADSRRSSSTTDAASSATAGGRAEALGALADSLIVPSYGRLKWALIDFEAASTRLCATPGESTLDAARLAWREAITAWSTTSAFGVGPAMQHRLMSAVGFDAREASVDNLLREGGPVGPSSLAKQGAAVRGLLAAEIALYGDGSESLLTSAGARRCEYLASVATVTSKAVAVVADEWLTGTARAEFVSLVGSDVEDSLPQLLNEVTQAVRDVDERSLRDIAAAASYGELSEGRRDGPGSFVLAQRRAQIRGAVTAIGSGEVGLVGMVRTVSPETAIRLEAAASGAMDAMNALPDSVEDVFDPSTENAAKVDSAAERVAELKVVLVTEVASQLGVTVTLGDGDGDA